MNFIVDRLNLRCTKVTCFLVENMENNGRTIKITHNPSTRHN